MSVAAIDSVERSYRPRMTSAGRSSSPSRGRTSQPRSAPVRVPLVRPPHRAVALATALRKHPLDLGWERAAAVEVAFAEDGVRSLVLRAVVVAGALVLVEHRDDVRR